MFHKYSSNIDHLFYFHKGFYLLYLARDWIFRSSWNYMVLLTANFWSNYSRICCFSISPYHDCLVPGFHLISKFKSEFWLLLIQFTTSKISFRSPLVQREAAQKLASFLFPRKLIITMKRKAVSHMTAAGSAARRLQEADFLIMVVFTVWSFVQKIFESFERLWKYVLRGSHFGIGSIPAPLSGNQAYFREKWGYVHT